MIRARIVSAPSLFEGRIGEVISRTEDPQGVEYVLVRFEEDERPMRFDLVAVELLDG